MALAGTRNENDKGLEEEDDNDAILAELEAEADNDIAVLRQQRIRDQLEQSKSQSGPQSSTTTQTSAKVDLTYVTLKSDDTTLQFTTEYDRALVHFFHSDFARCAIMDSHLETIATKQAEVGRGSEESETHFGRVDVRHAPFVVERMGIRVLPCVIGFVKGVVKGKIVGFEGLCWDGKEKGLRVCQAVEERLVDWGLLQRALVGKGEDDTNESDDDGEELRRGATMTIRRGIQGRKHQITDETDDWD